MDKYQRKNSKQKKPTEKRRQENEWVPINNKNILKNSVGNASKKSAKTDGI